MIAPSSNLRPGGAPVRRAEGRKYSLWRTAGLRTFPARESEPMNLYRHCVRPVLFRVDAETVHASTLALAERLGATAAGRALLRRQFAFHDDRLATRVAGLSFANPLGLAAGFDKNGRAIQALSALGFGFVEIGSVSAHPSAGNPRPRLFRLPADESIVVNYGVPNDGAQTVAARVASRPTPVPLGVNLVETNTSRPSAPDAVVAELVAAVRPFLRRADYITLNLNCPNTTGGASPFDDLTLVRTLLQEYAAIPGLPPVFLKLTAHADPARAEALLETVDPFPCVAGFVFNLPPGKAYPLRTPAAVVAAMPGTLCGPPARALADAAIRTFYGRMDRRRHAIIGSGGVSTADDAYRKIRLGASLVQLYTALVFHGPGLVRRIGEGLVRRLERDGLDHLDQAVGLDLRETDAGRAADLDLSTTGASR